MKEKFLMIPAPLRKQILLRCAGAGMGIAMLLLIMIYGGNWQFYLPCGIGALICLSSGWLLFDRCVNGRYVRIPATCIDIEKTGIRKRIKALYLQGEEHRIRLVGIKALRNISIGDQVVLYVAENTPVYEADGCKVICSYIALTKASGDGFMPKKEISTK